MRKIVGSPAVSTPAPATDAGPSVQPPMPLPVRRTGFFAAFSDGFERVFSKKALNDPSVRHEAFVRSVMSAVTLSVREGPRRAELLSRADALGDLMAKADVHFAAHNVYSDEDIRKVNEAASLVTELDPKFTLSDVDVHLKEKVSQLFFDTVNLATRFLGKTLHEGKWDGRSWSSWNREVKAFPKTFKVPQPPVASNRAALFAPVQEIVKNATSLRVVGGGHSFNESASTSSNAARPAGTMLSLDNYNRWATISAAESAKNWGVPKDQAEGVVRVQAGIRLRDLTKQLWDNGLAMSVAGSTDAQSLGGLIASDLHGTGRDHGFLSESLLEVTLAKANGGLLTFSKQDGKWKTDEEPPRTFDKLPVSGALGTLGVVVEAVMKTEKAYNLEKSVQFVSREEAEKNLAATLAKHDHVSFYYPGGSRADTVRMNTWTRTTAPSPWSAPFSRLAHEGQDTALVAYAPRLLNSLAVRDPKKDPLLKALNGEKPVVLPAPVSFARQLFFTHDEIEYGVPHENHQRTLDAVMKMLADEEFNSVVEVRITPDSSEALLGPGTAGRGKGGTTFIELATPLGDYSDARIAEVYAKFDQILRANGGRPHLGKKAAVDEKGMGEMYGKDWDAFQALRRELDPTNKFIPPDNVFLRKIFEPQA